ncbi:MAG: glycerate kinase [Candidatus Bathyarchaeota archaeon]|nr:MAG: glycerate kinase [Candidatus Bathyarchaeota archaeon]
MTKIRNKEELMNNAKSPCDRKARKLALDSLETALEAADPRFIIRSKVKLKENLLTVYKHRFDLRKTKNIFVVGGGKASGFMAEALEAILQNHITDGILNVPRADAHYRTQRIKLRDAGHPVPDEAGVEGARRMLNLAGQADENDLIICLISGGGSSLMPLPRDEIPLQDLRIITELLLRSGATITEINTVRKHISNFKGGWLAKEAYPSTVVNLILSDVVGDPLDSIASGPTVPDSTTFQDSINVLRTYTLLEKTPQSIRKILLDGMEGRVLETPKAGDVAFRKVHNFIVGSNRSASLAAHNKLRNTGLNTLLLTSYMEGEARQVGRMFAAIIREIVTFGKPVQKPAGIVSGGETTVTVVGKGTGGRNQEIALGAALKMDRIESAVIASMNTDGIDGPTDAAGALMDGNTMLRSQERGLDAEEFLLHNDSYTFFSKLGDLIFTGSTGTNVGDISVIVVI